MGPQVCFRYIRQDQWTAESGISVLRDLNVHQYFITDHTSILLTRNLTLFYILTTGVSICKCFLSQFLATALVCDGERYHLILLAVNIALHVCVFIQ